MTISRREAKAINNQSVLIELNKVLKKYDKEALRIKRLLFNKGFVYGIVGPSGAGKSTLLRLINMLTLPDDGTIFYNGQPTPDKGPARLKLQRNMAMVFQKTLLFRDSVYNNVAYGLKARGYSRDETNKRVDSLLEQVGLKELANRRADTLSGGEAQRVAIARAVAFDPELLLLDEPTANLDPANIEIIEDMIMKMNREQNITVIMVTHNIFQARRIADKVVFVNEGKIIEMGDTEQIFSEPHKLQTKAFIEGRMIY